VNWDPLFGVAITVTDVPGLYCMQLRPHATPAGCTVILPRPFPLLVVVKLTADTEFPEFAGVCIACPPVAVVPGFWGGAGVVVPLLAVLLEPFPEVLVELLPALLVALLGGRHPWDARVMSCCS
jgi:hypothetical protein